MKPDRLPSVLDAVSSAADRPVSIPAPAISNAGNASLAKAGAFPAFATATATYQVTVIGVEENRFEYKVDQIGATEITEIGRGFSDRDEVFGENVFILKHWWTGQAVVGDYFTFNVNPQAKTVPMPVLFKFVNVYQNFTLVTNGHTAFTTNPVNAIVNGDTVFYGSAYGPQATLAVLGGNENKDVFEEYFKRAFVQAGYNGEKLKSVDQRVYHDKSGGIHCATNVIRQIPAYKWWE